MKYKIYKKLLKVKIKLKYYLRQLRSFSTPRFADNHHHRVVSDDIEEFGPRRKDGKIFPLLAY